MPAEAKVGKRSSSRIDTNWPREAAHNKLSLFSITVNNSQYKYFADEQATLFKE